MSLFRLLGSIAMTAVSSMGEFGLFVLRAGMTLLRRGFAIRSLMFQANQVGVDSWGVVALTGAAIGAVLAHHAYDGLHRFHGEQFLGPLLYLSMAREFGSVISAIMVVARAGSAMTAEIGSMQISEQIDALTTLSIDPMAYIVIPRVLATTMIMPILSLVCVIFGVAAGYVISIYVLGVNPELYMETIKTNLEFSDFFYGLVKAAIFGLLTSLIACYVGLKTSGGARGVGKSTTQSVVASCITIFLANYILSAIFFPITS